jgi:hypothetical protein
MFTLICNLGENNILYSVSNVSFIVTKLTCSFVPWICVKILLVLLLLKLKRRRWIPDPFMLVM